MSQLFDKNRRTKKNLKTPKEIIWEVEEKNRLNINFFQEIIYKCTWIFLFLIRFLLYPLFDFKIGLLYSDKIGRFLGNTEFYLRKKSLGNNKKIPLHILISGRTVNNQILKMISRRAFLIKNISIYNYLSNIKKITNDSNLWIDLNITGWLRGKDWTAAKPQLSFSLEEEKRGKKLLQILGLDENVSFVCVFAKDNLYSDNPDKPPIPNSFWSKKDFRNCDIDNYLVAAEYLTKKNIFVIRMGLHEPEKVLETTNSMIIDYTGKIRKKLSKDDAEFADAYLPAKCKFFIGCTSGTYQFASIFNRPVAYTNMIPYGECGRNFHDLFIFKKCLNKKNNQLLSISDAIKNGITGDWLTEDKILGLESNNIFFEQNSQSEILELTKEMYKRLNNLWQPKDDELSLQEKFLKITKIYDSDGEKFPGKVSYYFLKNNPELL